MAPTIPFSRRAAGARYYLTLPTELTRPRFLLHYTARDAVDVLSQGVKGIAEMRQAAEAHCNVKDPPPSPIFGMIHFRRRKLLVKLVLEGASRLLQGWLSAIADPIADLPSARHRPLGLHYLTIPRPRLNL